jgi:RNA polymerase sigma factor (sigma-70 family)
VDGVLDRSWRTFPFRVGCVTREAPAMSDQPSTVTEWIGQLRRGDPEAARKLWQRYFARLVGLARAHLASLPRRAADEEDVALSVFASFCRAVEQGRYPDLQDRDELWSLLATLTRHRAEDLRRHEQAEKRGGGEVRGDSTLDSPDLRQGFAALAAREPTPAEAAELADRLAHLFGLLRDADLRRVAELKLQGYTNAEIAAAVGVIESTVERRLKRIRACWEKELGR